MAEKMNSYAKYVKEMYWPATTDEDKKNFQLESIKENIKPNRLMRRSDSIDENGLTLKQRLR